MFTAVPPLVGPVLGEIAVTVGAGFERHGVGIAVAQGAGLGIGIRDYDANGSSGVGRGRGMIDVV